MTPECPEPDRWVNALIHIVMPMDDVAVTDDACAKQEAAGRAADRIMAALPPELRQYVAGGGWEDMS